MEPATSAVAQPPPVQLGQTRRRGDWLGWASLTLVLTVFLAFNVGFAAAAYSARQRRRDLTYALFVYFLLLLFLYCVAKIEQLRRDPAAAAAMGLGVRCVAWGVLLTLVNTIALRAIRATPVMMMKLLAWAVATVVAGIAFYYLFCVKVDARCSNAEHGRGQA